MSDNERALRLLRAERERIMDELERGRAATDAYAERQYARLDSLTRTIALATIADRGITAWPGEV